MRSEVLTATSIKAAFFWNVVPCYLVDTDRHFIGSYFPDNGGNKLLERRSVCVKHPRRCTGDGKRGTKITGLGRCRRLLF